MWWKKGFFWFCCLAALLMGLAANKASAGTMDYKAADLPVALQIWSRPADEPTPTIDVAVYIGYFSVSMLAHDVLIAFPDINQLFVFRLKSECYHISFRSKDMLQAVKVCEVGNNHAAPKKSVGDSRYFVPKLKML